MAKSKPKTLNLEEKVKVIEKLEKGISSRKIAEEMGVLLFVNDINYYSCCLLTFCHCYIILYRFIVLLQINEGEK
jgi:hypothetical protein